jgi:undecaprenyl diphosphate synthase
VASVRDVVAGCGDLGVRQLTLYAFSTENWTRPRPELRFLWSLLRRFLVREREELKKNGIRFRTIGVIEELPKYVVEEIRKTEDATASLSGTTLCLALNYGSKREITDAVRALARRVRAGDLNPDEITPDLIEAHLYTAGMPPLDLLIRTASEQRLSNFLLWQASYAELYFSPVYWPDFRRDHLRRAVQAYARRERRFGGLKPVE